MVAVHLGQTLGFGHEVGTGHNQHVGCRQAVQVLVGHGFKARNLVERERGVESHKLGGRAALARRESHAHCLTLAVDHCRQVHLGYVQGVGDIPHQCLAACSGHYHLDCVAQHGVTHVEATGFLAGIAIGVLIGHGGIVEVCQFDRDSRFVVEPDVQDATVGGFIDVEDPGGKRRVEVALHIIFFDIPDGALIGGEVQAHGGVAGGERGVGVDPSLRGMGRSPD